MNSPPDDDDDPLNRLAPEGLAGKLPPKLMAGGIIEGAASTLVILMLDVENGSFASIGFDGSSVYADSAGFGMIKGLDFEVPDGRKGLLETFFPNNKGFAAGKASLAC